MRTLWAILQCLHSDKVGLLNSNLPPFKQRFKEQVVIGAHNTIIRLKRSILIKNNKYLRWNKKLHSNDHFLGDKQIFIPKVHHQRCLKMELSCTESDEKI